MWKKIYKIIPIQNKYLSKCPKWHDTYVPILKCKNKNDGKAVKKLSGTKLW